MRQHQQFRVGTSEAHVGKFPIETLAMSGGCAFDRSNRWLISAGEENDLEAASDQPLGLGSSHGSTPAAALLARGWQWQWLEESARRERGGETSRVAMVRLATVVSARRHDALRKARLPPSSIMMSPFARVLSKPCVCVTCEGGSARRA